MAPSVDLSDALTEASTRHQRTLDEAVVARLLQFGEVVQRWAELTDLTSAREPAEVAAVLYDDALALLNLFEQSEVPATLVDIGAGLGAPGIPLAIMMPELRVHMVEPRRRRVAVMRMAIGALRLAKRVTLEEAKIVVDQPEVIGMPFDLALSRATFAPELWRKVGAQLGKRVAVLLASERLQGDDLLSHIAYTNAIGSPRHIEVY